MSVRTFIFLVFFSITQIKADITFTNGFWSTSFDNCLEGVTQKCYQCDGFNIEDDYNISGTYSRVRTVNNDASGGVGKVFTLYYEGNVRNSMSTAVTVRFSEPQKEFWLRFYYRLPSGQSVGSIFEHKIIYAFTDNRIAARVNWPGQGDQITLCNEFCEIYYGPDGGWASLYGSVSSPADASWHCFEFHFDLGTSSSNNGVFEMWVDGINYVSERNLNCFNNATVSAQGWSYIDIPSNHNVFLMDGINPHDIDNIAVAIPSYAAFNYDSGGRRFIGLSSNGGTNTVVPPTGFKIQ